MCAYVCVCMCHIAHMELRSQLCGVGSLHLYMGSRNKPMTPDLCSKCLYSVSHLTLTAPTVCFLVIFQFNSYWKRNHSASSCWRGGVDPHTVTQTVPDLTGALRFQPPKCWNKEAL